MRKLSVIIGFALVVAACGGDADPVASSAPAAQAETTQTAPPSTTQEAPTQATDAPPAETTESTEPVEPTEAAGPSFDGPPAPDFELALYDGSTFRLSDEEKPVYMVFWAEW